MSRTMIKQLAEWTALPRSSPVQAQFHCLIDSLQQLHTLACRLRRRMSGRETNPEPSWHIPKVDRPRRGLGCTTA
jgi:hypothetical protein